MTVLYEHPPTRSQRTRWVLEELEVPYTRQPVNLLDGQQNTDAYRAIHPHGVVPALRTARYTIYESVAIVMQLIDEHPEKSLAPPAGTPERAVYYQWCVFAGTEMDPALMGYFDNALRWDYNRTEMIGHSPVLDAATTFSDGTTPGSHAAYYKGGAKTDTDGYAYRDIVHE